MKIFQITQHYLPFIGGVEISIHEICKRLVRYGFNIEVLCGQEVNTIGYEELDGVEIRRVMAFEPFRLRYSVGRISPEMLRYVRTTDADIVHAHSYGFFATWASLVSDKPKVITAHSNPTARIYPILDLFRAIPIRICDYVVALTHKEKAHLLRRGASKERVVVIPNGISLPPPEGKDLRLHPMILCMGRIDFASKGQDILMRAMKRVYAAVPEAKLVIAGDGPDFALARHMVKQLGLEKCTKLTGVVLGQDKWDYLGSSDVVCIPSRTESFPMICLEAMASGKPVVTTEVGAIPEVMADAAIYVSPNNPDLLAEALIQTLEERELARHLTRKGLHRIKMYSIEPVVQKYKALYESVCRA